MKKKNLFWVEVGVKIAVFVLLMFLALFLFGCSQEEPEMPSGEMLRFEVDNPEQGMWRTYSIGGEETDLFEKWQEDQANQLYEKDWQAYMMDNEN